MCVFLFIFCLTLCFNSLCFSFLWGVLTVESNQDRDFLICQDQLLKVWRFSWHVKMSFFKLSRILISQWRHCQKLRYIENCWEYLNSQDTVFQTVKNLSAVKNFSTDETWFFQMSRSWVSIEITLRQIENQRLIFF